MDLGCEWPFCIYCVDTDLLFNLASCRNWRTGKFFGQDGTPRGIGNQVSAEFNLVYRWHSAISDKDDKWTQELYKRLFGKPSEQVTMEELLMGLGKWEHSLDDDPVKREFHGLQRGADGKFSDDELVQILTESIEDTAGKKPPKSKISKFGSFPKCI